MRSYIFCLAPFLAAAYAQSEEDSSSSSSSYVYTNPLTSYLTETNAFGVVTGMPDNAGTAVTSIPNQPALVTSQPDVATIPAGLPIGETAITLPRGNGTSITAFTISVGTSTTVVLSATPTTPVVPSDGSDNDNNNDNDNDQSQTSGSATPSPTTGAASAVTLVSGAVLGAGAFLVALL